MKASSIDTLYQEAFETVRRITRQFFLVRISRSLLIAFALFLGGLILFVLADILLDLSVPIRIVFWCVTIMGAAISFMLFVRPNLKGAVDPDQEQLYDISRKIGRNDSSVADAIINFLQIYRDEGITSRDVFKNLSLNQLHQKFKHTDFSTVISTSILKEPARRIGVIAGILLLLFIVFPTHVGQAMLKLVYPTRSFAKPLPITLLNLSGDQLILKNEPVTLQGRYEGIAPHQLWLVVKAGEANEDSVMTERIEIAPEAGNRFSYEFGHVKQGFHYWFEATVQPAAFISRPALSSKGNITVKERPFVRNLQLKLGYPDYTRLPAALLSPNNGEVSALKGTAVTVSIEANKRLSGAVLHFSSGDTLSMEVVENRASVEFKVSKDDQYFIRIDDLDGISNFQPVRYGVFALQDEMPYVEIAEPGEDLELGDALVVPLLMNLRDDYGFRQLNLKGRHVHVGGAGDTTTFSTRVKIQALEQNRAIADLNWDLSSFFMIPDDYIEYYAEVFDNDNVTGPKRAVSKTFVVRLPSLIDILNETEQNMAEQLEDMQDVANESTNLKEKLEEISREMLRENELDWERKQEIEDQMNRQKEAFKKLDEIQQQLQEQVENLDSQNMLSPETLDKYFELQEMLKDIATPEMLEAMEKLQDAMEKSNMEEMRQAMQEFELSVEQFQQQIERAHELFERVMQEQKMDELVNLAEKLAEQQQEINEELARQDLNDSQKEQLSDKEENLQQNTEFFEEQLAKTSEEFQKELADIASELAKAQEYMQNQQLSQQMQNMQQQISQNEMQQAQQSGQSLEQQLEMLQSMMQQARREMTEAQKQELAMEMQKVQEDLLNMSFSQEKMLSNSRDLDVASSQITDLAREQSQLKENARQVMQQLMEVAKKSFFISPQMSQMMAEMMENMEGAQEQLEQRNPRNAGQSQQKAMANMNQAIMSMQNSMNQMMQAGSASGFQEYMEQLQKMAGQQGQLNQGTMGLFQQQGEGGQQPGRKPSPEALARLAAQQQMIKESLGKMSDQMGNRRDVLGRLDQMGEDMEKVIEDLSRQKLDRKVLERQQRILSRLLDAQKSVREREYSKKRLAEQEAAGSSASPPPLKQELLERENQLRKEMLESMKEGYSSEYKEFIKSYYEILSRQPRVNQ